MYVFKSYWCKGILLNTFIISFLKRCIPIFERWDERERGGGAHHIKETVIFCRLIHPPPTPDGHNDNTKARPKPELIHVSHVGYVARVRGPSSTKENLHGIELEVELLGFKLVLIGYIGIAGSGLTIRTTIILTYNMISLTKPIFFRCLSVSY